MYSSHSVMPNEYLQHNIDGLYYGENAVMNGCYSYFCDAALRHVAMVLLATSTYSTHASTALL